MKTSTIRPFLAVLAVSIAGPLAAQGTNEAGAIESGTHPLLWLAILTLGIIIGFALWQRRKVTKAKRTHEHSSLSEGHHYADAQRRNDPR